MEVRDAGTQTGQMIDDGKTMREQKTKYDVLGENHDHHDNVRSDDAGTSRN